MRIAILTDGIYPYVMGGMQRHSFYLIKYLAKQKIHVTLIHFNQSKHDIIKLDTFTEDEKVFIENIVIPFPKKGKLPGHYIRASHEYSCHIFEQLDGRWKEFDFIYSKGFSSWKLIEEKIKNPMAYPPVSVMFHGYEMFQKASKLLIMIHQRMLRNPVKWMTKNADYVFSYGAKISDIILNLGIDSSKIVEVPAGIEDHWLIKESKKVNNPIVFTFLGRYERRKGVEELNSAIKLLLKDKLDFNFNFIGPFEKKHRIISDNVIYHGQLDDNVSLKRILDQSDVLVCPSWSEGMPNVILEAMARGCAIIATDVGAVSLMLDSSNGKILTPGNVPELYNAIKYFIEIDKETLNKLQVNSIHKIENEFIYDKIIMKFINKINSLLKHAN